MNRSGVASVASAVFLAAAASARAQLVPITRCNSAIPCNIPMGLRPADAAAWTPGNNLGQGNTGISVSSGLDKLQPKIDRPPVSEDPVEAAARMYVRRYPVGGTPRPTGVPTPKAPSAAAAASAPKRTPTPAP
jgi:hypothetical protein